MVLAIPRQTLPAVMLGFKSEDRQLAFRVEKRFVESQNFTTTCQSHRKLRVSFYCIHTDDSLEFIEFELLFGYICFGAIIFINKRIGVTQGVSISWYY